MARARQRVRHLIAICIRYDNLDAELKNSCSSAIRRKSHVRIVKMTRNVCGSGSSNSKMLPAGEQSQGLPFWLFQRGLKVSLGTAGGIEVLTLIFLK